MRSHPPILLIALVGAALALAAAPPSRAAENLVASGTGARLVYFSSQYDDTEWKIGHLFDGSTATGWAGSSSGAQSMVIAFAGDGLARIESMIINPYTREPRNTWAKDVEIQVSTTYPFKGFRSAGRITLTNEGVDQTLTLVEPAEARYLKVLFLTNYGDAYMEAGELQVMGTLVPGAPPALPYRNAAAAEGGAKIEPPAGGDGSLSPEWSAANLLGPDGGNGWATRANAAGELVIALPKVTAISDISIDNYARGHREDWAKTVEVELSRSARKGFQPVGEIALPQIGDLHTLSLAQPVAARYVKLRFGSNYGGEYRAVNRVRVWTTPAGHWKP